MSTYDSVCTFTHPSPVQLQNFSLGEAVSYTMHRDTSKVRCEESVPIVLDGDKAQRVVSADGFDVLYRVPAAFEGKSLVRFSSGCLLPY